MDTSQFLKAIDAAIEARGMTATEFGRLAVKDPNFVFDVRASRRSPTLKTVEKVMRFIREEPAQ